MLMDSVHAMFYEIIKSFTFVYYKIIIIYDISNPSIL